MLLVDTGPLLATADRDDVDHAVCRALLEGDEGPLVTTPMDVAETAYLIDRQLGPAAEATLYDAILDGGLRVENLIVSDWQRIRELVESYANLRLGGTDASLIAVAERLGTTRIATLNHRHFRVVRPAHSSPDSTSSVSKVICRRCRSNPHTMPSGTSLVVNGHLANQMVVRTRDEEVLTH